MQKRLKILQLTVCLQQLGRLTEACHEECFQYLLCGLAGPRGGKWVILHGPDPWGRRTEGVLNHNHPQNSSDEEYLKSPKLNLINEVAVVQQTLLYIHDT